MKATGSRSLMLVGAEALLADSPTFRASINAADADQAKERIHFVEIQAFDEAFPLPAQRPAILLLQDSFGYEQMGQGAGQAMGARGGVAAIFTKNALASRNDKEVVLDFENWLGGIVDECSERVGHGDYWPFATIEVVQGPYRSDHTERAEDDYWVAAVIFSHRVVQ